MIAGNLHRGTALDKTEASRRRRAVHRALKPYLQDEDLIRALWVWEESAAESAFALHEFASRVCAGSGLQELRAAVHLSLVKCMTMPIAELGSDPWPLMQAGRRAGPVISLPTPAAQAVSVPAGNLAGTVVFEAVLGHFFLKLRDQRSENVNRIRLWLIEHIGSHREFTGLGGHSAMCIVRWLNGTAESIGTSLDTLVLRRIVHAAYVVACEFYGPVVADAALADAVRTAEARPEAKQFEPRSLL